MTITLRELNKEYAMFVEYVEDCEPEEQEEVYASIGRLHLEIAAEHKLIAAYDAAQSLAEMDATGQDLDAFHANDL